MDYEKPARIDQILASLGYGSRNDARTLVRQGRVQVDGQPVKQAGQKVLPGDVLLDGQPLEDAGPLLVLMHKPAGYVCSHDEREGPRVYDLLPSRWLTRNPVPVTVGRLDKDTTGALLITDQTSWVHQLTSPKRKVHKVYRARLATPPQEAWIAELASGRLLLAGEDRPCAPAQLTILDQEWVELVLTEGRYHQVKRMFAQLGSEVVALHRVRFGPWSADHLEAGSWEKLGLAEASALLAESFGARESD